MRFLSTVLTLALVLPCVTHAHTTETVTRNNGLAMIWEGLNRPTQSTNETPFTDVQQSHANFNLITFAKARGIVQDGTLFYPNAPLRIGDAMLWLLRSRNVDRWERVKPESIRRYAENYGLKDVFSTDTPYGEDNVDEFSLLTARDLSNIINTLDTNLRNEVHAVSYYSDGFAGRNTAFGEIFNPNDLTAAHRTFPQHTLVKVTNQDNGKSVTVRINDRGPYYPERDMDLSRAAFQRIGSISNGVLRNVTFERIGYWEDNEPPYAEKDESESVGGICNATYKRTAGETTFTPGFPSIAEKGSSFILDADRSFRMLLMRAPRTRPIRSREWVNNMEITFDTVGTYIFVVHEDTGKRARFRTRVVRSCEAK